MSHRNGLFENHVVVDIKCCFLLHVAGSYSKQMLVKLATYCSLQISKQFLISGQNAPDPCKNQCITYWHSRPSSLTVFTLNLLPFFSL